MSWLGRIFALSSAVLTIVIAPVSAAPATALDPPPPTRINDPQPHFGGAEAAVNKGGICTSGFSVLVGGNPTKQGSVTAGHCANAGNGSLVVSGTVEYGFIANALNNNDFDMALITGIKGRPQTYAPSIWVDPMPPNAIRVTGSRDPQVGDKVCVSGRLTKNLCDITIRDASDGRACASTPQGVACTFHLALGQATVNPAFVEGNSGAPVYILNNDGQTKTATIVGILIGGDDIHRSRDFITIEQVSKIQDNLGVTVMVSSP